MDHPKLLDEISHRLSELVAASPVKDIEKNARGLLTSAFARMDLVTREEFDVQKEVLARAHAKIVALEARVAALEAAASERDAT